MLHLRQAVAHLTARQRKEEMGQIQDNKLLAQGLYQVMRTLGLSPTEAEQALRLPGATPLVVPPAANATPTTPLAPTPPREEPRSRHYRSLRAKAKAEARF